MGWLAEVIRDTVQVRQKYGKNHVIIAWSVNKSSEPLKINTKISALDGAHMTSLVGVGDPLVVDDWCIINGIIAEPDECGVMRELTHTWVTILWWNENITLCENWWILTSQFVAYVEWLKRVELFIYVIKL